MPARSQSAVHLISARLRWALPCPPIVAVWEVRFMRCSLLLIVPRAATLNPPNPPPATLAFSTIGLGLPIVLATPLVVLYGAGLYLGLLSLLALPWLQRALIYLHWVRYPPNADFNEPSHYGFAPRKVLPLRLKTRERHEIGAWLVLPDSLYNAANPAPLTEDSVIRLLRDNDTPVVLYNHGNAATRAAPNRVQVGRYVAAMGAAYLIYDYRGFADSGGEAPNEAGLLRDARTAWDYLVENVGVAPERITVMAQSLGTGVATGLLASLAKEGTNPHSLILVAPFSSIPNLLETYLLFNFIPLFGPIRGLPFGTGRRILDTFLLALSTRFESINLIDTISCPILIMHARNDPTIPASHSAALFETLRGGKGASTKAAVESTTLGTWGVISTFTREKGGHKVVWSESERGAHNEVGTSDVALRLIAEFLPPPGKSKKTQ